MGTRELTITYDTVGDILYVDFVPRHAGQESDMVSDFVVARFDRETGQMDGFDVLFFAERARNGESTVVAIDERLGSALPAPSHG